MRVLVYFGVVLPILSAAIAGRFRLPFKEGSRGDRTMDGAQLGCNVFALGVELLLPFATGFVGLPGLAFAAAALRVAALSLFTVRVPVIGPFAPNTSGRHSVDEASIRRTRWPYQALFAAAHILLIAFLASLMGRLPPA